MKLLGRWWNGRWGRLTRRDIWLKLDQTWRVEARTGDGDAKVWSHDYATEADALAAIVAMMDRTGGREEWRLLSDPPNPVDRGSSSAHTTPSGPAAQSPPSVAPARKSDGRRG
jgi:hypothetical protein